MFLIPFALFALMAEDRSLSVCSSMSARSYDSGITVHVLPTAQPTLPASAVDLRLLPPMPTRLVPGALPKAPTAQPPPPPPPPPPQEVAPAEAGTTTSTQGSPVGAGPAAEGYRRQVIDSYSSRTDVGCCGVYNGNWGGNRQAVLQRHVNSDIAEGAPCHIVTAQEVDPAFVNKMMTVRERSGQLKWHVLALDHGDNKTVIIAARRSFASAVQMCERHVTNDGEYKVKGGKNSNKRRAVARSRMLVGEVVCQEPVDGRKTLIVATVHLHHQTAKKASVSPKLTTRGGGALSVSSEGTMWTS